MSAYGVFGFPCLERRAAQSLLRLPQTILVGLPLDFEKKLIIK
jgi:hypothetical protein